MRQYDGTPVTPVTEMAGKRFGRLLVLERDLTRKGHQAYWKCRCDCGNTKSINGSSLRRGLTTSCGCHRKEALRKANRKHGCTHSPEWKSWVAMRARCYDQGCGSYERYGGRGITVCERWLGEHGFQNFIADMGQKPTPQHQLERIDNAKFYYPENCRWATRKEQSINRKGVHLITHNGRTMCATDWRKELGIPKGTYESRRSYGWSVLKSLGLE